MPDTDGDVDLWQLSWASPPRHPPPPPPPPHSHPPVLVLALTPSATTSGPHHHHHHLPSPQRVLKITELLRLRDLRLREAQQLPPAEVIAQQPRLSQSGFTCSFGATHPLGATVFRELPGTDCQAPVVNFAVLSSARSLSLCLFASNDDGREAAVLPTHEIALDPVFNRTGRVWHIAVHGLPLHWAYGYRVNGSEYICLDPHAKRLRGPSRWGDRAQAQQQLVRYDFASEDPCISSGEHVLLSSLFLGWLVGGQDGEALTVPMVCGGLQVCATV